MLFSDTEVVTLKSSRALYDPLVTLTICSDGLVVSINVNGCSFPFSSLYFACVKYFVKPDSSLFVSANATASMIPSKPMFRSSLKTYTGTDNSLFICASVDSETTSIGLIVPPFPPSAGTFDKCPHSLFPDLTAKFVKN